MNPSFIYGLLAGCVIGVLCQYLIQKFSEYNSLLDDNASNQMAWDELFNTHAHFITDLKKDLADPEYKNIREFFVVEPQALLNLSTPRLRYELTEGTVAAVDALEQYGCIQRLNNNCRLYKLEENFVANLHKIM